MISFNFNKKNSWKDIGIVIESIKHSLPEPNIVVEEIPCQDGEYDYTEVNPDGRTRYKSKTIEITCSIKCDNSTSLKEKAREIKAWLRCGKQDLTFDDEPDIIYRGRIANKIDLETIIAKFMRFTLIFRCEPFELSRVPYKKTFLVDSPRVLSVKNRGTFVKPGIIIEGSFTNITFSVNDKVLSYNHSLFDAKIELDCGKMKAIKDDNINVLNYTSGQFIELNNGINQLQVSGTDLNCTITITFKCKY